GTSRAKLSEPSPGCTSLRSVRESMVIVSPAVRGSLAGAFVYSALPELFRYQLASDDGLYPRLDRIGKMIMLPRNSDIDTIPLPRALWPVYYLLRPLLIVLRILGLGWMNRSQWGIPA